MAWDNAFPGGGFPEVENRGHPGDFSGLAGARWQRIMHVEQPNPRALPTRPVIPVEVEVVLVDGRVTARGEGERRGEETEGVRPHRADGSILLQDRGNSSPFVTWLILLR